MTTKIGRNQPCPCGGGKKYKRCHGAPGADSWSGSDSERAPKHPREMYANAVNVRSFTCLAGAPNSCTEPAVRAHSIQNSKDLMGRIAIDGHVAMVRAKRMTPFVELTTVGRNKASTFTGLCGTHDNEIFRPIDTADLDVSNPEHLFLLAFRALLREQHAMMEGALRTEKAADQVPDPLGEEMKEHYSDVTQRFGEYRRSYFDPVYESCDYAAMEHDIIEVETRSATVAVSSLFSLDQIERGDDVVRVALSVVPVSHERSTAVISYAPHDAELARIELAKYVDHEASDIKLGLSRLIVDTSENFILSPRFVETWSREKSKAIEDAVGSLSVHSPAPTSDLLMLFD